MENGYLTRFIMTNKKVHILLLFGSNIVSNLNVLQGLLFYTYIF